MSTAKCNSATEHALLQVNKIPVHLVEEIVAQNGRLICRVKPPVIAQCPRCHSTTRSVKNRYGRTIHGIGLPGFSLEVEIITTHFVCSNKDCSIKTFAVDQGIADGKSPYLPALKNYVAQESFGHEQNNTEISRDLHDKYQVFISEATLRRIEKNWRLKPIDLSVKVLGIDEFSPKGKHGTHTALFDLDRGIVLGIIKGKSQESLRKLLKQVQDGGINLDGVKLVVRDLYPHWDKVLKEFLGHIQIVADPFHVVKWVQNVLYQQYYAPLRKWLRTHGRNKESVKLFHARWAWRKSAEKLTIEQDNRLTEVFRKHTVLEQAWLLKEWVAKLYRVETRKKAREILNRCLRYSRERHFEDVGKTLKKNAPQILNAFVECNGSRRELKHYPEERIAQIRKLERKRGCFRNVGNLFRHLQIGYQFRGII